MSILIEGMEMPKEGYKVIYVHSNGSVYQPSNAENIWHKIASAIPVPPHGRLIDADKLKSYWEPDHSRYFDADYFIHTIDVAQTIIPASEEG